MAEDIFAAIKRVGSFVDGKVIGVIPVLGSLALIALIAGAILGGIG